MGSTAEAAVYSQVGISLFFVIPRWWSFSLIFTQLVIIIIGRVAAIVMIYYGFLRIFKK